jgi:hypothetical protein
LHVFGEGIDVAGGGLLEEREVYPGKGLTEGRGEGKAFGGDGGIKNLRERKKWTAKKNVPGKRC